MAGAGHELAGIVGPACSGASTGAIYLTVRPHLTPLAVGNIVILTENDRNGNKITV